MKHIILILLFVLSAPGLADMISLQNCMVDTGSYYLPVGDDYRYITQPSDGPGNSTVESIAWHWPESDPWSCIIVLEHNEPQPVTLTEALTALMSSNDSCGRGCRVSLKPVYKPYPGYIGSCNRNGTNLNMIGYVGEVNEKTWVVVFSAKEPDDVAYLLENLRIIPKSEENDVITQKLAERLS